MNKIIASLMIAGAIALSGCGHTPHKPPAEQAPPSETVNAPFVRKNASTPAAQADLAALQAALSQMQALGCNDPSSWYYQGAIHAIPPTITGGINPLCPSYTQIGQLKWAWNTCTHQEGSEIHFLIWHRLYIQHFESLVRKLSGKADFALPYWDYTNTTDKALYRVMPAALRDTASSLYSNARLPSLNQGAPIQNTPLANMDELLDVTTLFQNRVFEVFSNQIDKAPHGAMHNYIGGFYNDQKMWNPIYHDANHNGLMAEIPSAGFDPVFWLHHANIDYLWQKWERSPDGVRPTLAQLQAVPWPYQFYDENGKRVEYSIPQAYAAAFNPDYIYDQLGTPVAKTGSPAAAALQQRQQQQKAQRLWTTKPLKAMQAKQLDIPLTQRPPHSTPAPDAPGALVLQVSASFTQEPKGAYAVYVVDRQKVEKLAGYMTFFGAAHHAQAGHGHHDARQPLRTLFMFDVSDEVSAADLQGIRVKSLGNRSHEIRIDEISLLSY